jgi:P-type Ca2+ transporter type 2C
MFDINITSAFGRLNSSKKGLSSTEASNRLGRYGLNEIEKGHHISPYKIFLEQFASPLVWILLVALIISAVLGEIENVIVIGIIVVLNSILGFIQEYRAEKSIEALQKMASLKAKVIRDGKEILVDSKYLVPGDIIVLETGDKVPADCRLIEVHDFKTQEGPLTGESLPIRKIIQTLPKDTPLAEQKNMVFASTVVSLGRSIALVTKTGMNTQIGKIATLISQAHQKYTPLQLKLRELGKYITIAVIIVAIIVFLAGILTGTAASIMFLTAIALAVAAIPEGLPAVITVSLALGVQKMIKRNVLVRKLPSVETLGSVNVICTDKTGTLTHNQMTVTKIWDSNTLYNVTGSGYSSHGAFTVGKKLVKPDSLNRILMIGMLCNDAKLSNVEDKDNKSDKDSQNKDNKDNSVENNLNNLERSLIGDPTEAALLVCAEKAGLSLEKLQTQFKRVDEIGFTSERKMMTTIHSAPKETKIALTKGAVDVILTQCNRILINGKVQRLDKKSKQDILAKNEELAGLALRVLGFAYNKTFTSKQNAEKDMVFVGLQAMIDPPREEVKDSILQCQHAGIRVIMITGDHLTTAKAIAQELGITGKAITGQELEAIKDLEKEIEHIGILARVKPEHKMRVVEALQKIGYVVAMTGDGVNDAPALKKADIGVSMSISGTDVAKEAADMILTDDNFTSIVSAVEEGRGIFDNIRKFVNYLLSSNLGEIVVILFASLFGMPLPLTAIQILWINLVTDGLPAMALSVDPHEKDIMKRKPRDAKESILSKSLTSDILFLGCLIGFASLGLFKLYLSSGLIKAQTITFTAIVLFEVARLQAIRSKFSLGIFSNKLLVLAVVSSLLLHLITIYTPLRSFFGTVALEWIDWVIIIAAAAALYAINEVYYWIRDRVSVKNKSN